MNKVIVDAMGGDYAPLEVVLGASLARKEFGIDSILVGRREEIRKILDEVGEDFEIVDARDVVTMEDKPIYAFRRKKDSSINVSMNLLKEKKGCVVVSAGNTGAVLTSSYFILGKIEGVVRPTQSAIIPTLSGFLVLVDAGANVDAKSDNLVEWAKMGKVFSKIVSGKERIKIGLLNIGEEEEKGNEITKEAYRLLKDAFPSEFEGNMEGKDFLTGKFDLCVTDGFTGNIALKSLEGEASLFLNIIRGIFKKNIITNLSWLLVGKEFKREFSKFDYEVYGGSPILGIDGVVIVAHGRSKRRAIKNAIKMGKELSDKGLIEKLRNEISH
ncbi:MAG: phosphate acyltransferase PlsX [Caldisericia bacterium]|nr:phosphate acyltransferase PlsX [Caldisericia bacterium]